MNNNTTIIAGALAAVNADLMNDLISSAKPLIARIDSLKLGIAENQKLVAEQYKKLVALASSKIDDSFLASVPNGASKDTVLAVIKKMNEDRQASVEIEAKNIAAQIDTIQVRISGDEKNMEGLVKQLTELKPRTVTVPNVAA